MMIESINSNEMTGKTTGPFIPGGAYAVKGFIEVGAYDNNLYTAGANGPQGDGLPIMQFMLMSGVAYLTHAEATVGEKKVDKVRIYRADTDPASGGNYELLSEFATTEHQYTDESIWLYHDQTAMPGASYWYQVIPFSTTEGEGTCATKKIESRPTAPTALTTTPQLAAVDLAWTPVATTRTKENENVVGYKIYRSLISGTFTDPAVGDVTGVTVGTFSDSTVIAGKNYFYVVRAYTA